MWFFREACSALDTNVSKVFESFSRCGFQTDEANSSCSLMNVGLMIRAFLSDHELNVFFINPITQFAFKAAEFTCSCHMP